MLCCKVLKAYPINSVCNTTIKDIVRSDDFGSIDEVCVVLDGDGNIKAGKGLVGSAVLQRGKVTSKICDNVVVQQSLKRGGTGIVAAGGSNGFVAWREDGNVAFAGECVGEIALRQKALEAAMVR
jgi:hypothetical protein